MTVLFPIRLFFGPEGSISLPSGPHVTACGLDVAILIKLTWQANQISLLLGPCLLLSILVLPVPIVRVESRLWSELSVHKASGFKSFYS